MNLIEISSEVGIVATSEKVYKLNLNINARDNLHLN